MLRPWHHSLALDKSSPLSIHQQLTEHFRNMIEGGAWLRGSPLPSTRDIAQQLGINRKTVARVYEELSAQGLIYTQPKRGTFVADMYGNRNAAVDIATGASAITATSTIVLQGAAQPGASSPLDSINQLIQKTCLHHTRRAALHMHKLRPHDYDHGGLLSLKHMLANLLAHEKHLLVSPQQMICCSGLTLELAVIELLKPLSGYLLIDHAMSPTLRDRLEKQGLRLLELPAIPGHQPEAMAEQLEKYCINYPVSALWYHGYRGGDHGYMVDDVVQQQESHARIAQKLQDYALILVDDQRSHVGYGSPLAAKYTQQSLMLGSLYGNWCDMFNVHYIASTPTLTEALLCSIDPQQQHNMLLNMLVQSELIKRGDYKKLMSAIHRFSQQMQNTSRAA